MNAQLTSPFPVASPDRDRLLRRVLSPRPQFELSAAGDVYRPEAKRFVAEKFLSAWQARVNGFMPWLLSMHCLGQCTAVAGIRPAAGARLFLERYLDLPVEAALRAAAGVPVKRDELVEIGNLVAAQRGASHVLFLVFSAALHRAGYRWIVFTATRALRNNLGKLGFPMLELAPASASKLAPEELVHWGTYYQSEPLVVAGSLDKAMAIIENRPLLRRVLRLYQARIDALAARLVEARP